MDIATYLNLLEVFFQPCLAVCIVRADCVTILCQESSAINRNWPPVGPPLGATVPLWCHHCAATTGPQIGAIVYELYILTEPV